MNENMIDPKPLGVHGLPASEVVPRVETEPNQSDEGCGAKDAIEHAAIALDRNSKSENLSEQSYGFTLITPRNAEGRGTEDPTNRALTSANVTRMLEELSQEEVSTVMGSASSFSEDYTDATDEFDINSEGGDRDSQKVKRLLEFWEPPSEDKGPKDARRHLSCDFSTREVNKSSLASREPPSYSGGYRTAAVAKGAANVFGEVDRDASRNSEMSSLAAWKPSSYSEEENYDNATKIAVTEISSLAAWEPPSNSKEESADKTKIVATISGEVDRDANRNSEMSGQGAWKPTSYSEGESVDNAAKAATISGKVGRDTEQSSLAAWEPPSYSKKESPDKTKIAANISKEVDRDTKDTDKSSLASWERDYSEDDSTEGATDKKLNSSASSQAGSDFEGEKRPNWLDPRSVPAIQNRPEHVEPCLPDTYFGKLHHNGPFSYFGRAEPGEQTPLLLEEQEDMEEGQQEKGEQEDMEESQQEKDEQEDMEKGQQEKDEQEDMEESQQDRDKQEDMEESWQEKDEQDEKALSQVSSNEPPIASTEAEGDSDGIADVPGVFRRLPAWRRLTVVEQGEEAEEYDPEFPALSTPSEKLSAASLEKIGDMPNAVTKWLYNQSFHSVESKQHVVESLAKYSLLCYDDEEDEPQTERAPKKDEDQLEKRDISRLQLNDAIPECCLTDSVFLVDRPKDAVSLDFKLPPLSLEGCAVEAFIKIRVTHVYTPFQFWFNFVEQGNDVGMLAEMESEMSNFYNDRNPDYLNVLPGCLLKPGYMCAVRTEATWRRARILGTPPPGADTVSIYYVDYGSHADVSAGDLRYLSTHFGELPPLAVRGTLSYIHPPDTHWPPDSMDQFHRLVIDKELFAHINEVDLVEKILFLRISQNKEFQPSINRMLVDARLAGKSSHYDPRHIKNNLGRRQRYLRERLPSHEMLETGVFPVLNEEFEVEFDGIIYSPAFERFEVPKVKAAYSALREALVAWMPAYRKETEHWGRLYREERIKLRQAQRKIREDWLATQGNDLLHSRAEQETDDRLVALDRKIDEAIENIEKVEAMAPDPVDESSEPDQDEGTRREGDMDMVD